MLPSVYHKQACRLFCRMLHRLEERDSRSVESHSTADATGARENELLEAATRYQAPRNHLSPRFDARTDEERERRNAAG
jgi:hypothetical protein